MGSYAYRYGWIQHAVRVLSKYIVGHMKKLSHCVRSANKNGLPVNCVSLQKVVVEYEHAHFPGRATPLVSALRMTSNIVIFCPASFSLITS